MESIRSQHDLHAVGPGGEGRLPIPAELAASEPGRLTIMACPDCDLLNHYPTVTRRTHLCMRCGAVLYRHRPDTVDRSLALTCAALILFIISNSFPFLAMKSGGLIQQTTLISGIVELWRQELYALSAVVMLTCLLVPLTQMTGLLYILAPLKWVGRPAPQAHRVFRLILHATPWGMMEVFMLGILVALVKLGKMATIVPGISAFSFVVLIQVMAWAVSNLNPAELWVQLDRRR
jgi:paraquat-inducible protein A